MHLKTALARHPIGAATLLTVALLSGAEWATRLAVESNTTLNIYLGGFKEYHPTRGTQLVRNYDRGDIAINSHGLLGPEFDIVPDSTTIRMLAIGNSVTFSPPARNYPTVVRERLAALFPGDSLEMLTAAVPGYSSHDALDWYDEFLHRLAPDVAIVHLGWNDLGQYHPFGLRYKNEPLGYRAPTLIGRMMQRLYLFRVPYLVVGYLERKRPIDASPLTPEERRLLDGFHPDAYERTVVRLVEGLRDDGAAVYLVSLAGLISNQPTIDEQRRMAFPRGMGKKLAIYRAVYDAYDRALTNVARITGAPLLDLRELIRHPAQREIFLDAKHVDRVGSERYGEFIAASIRDDIAALVTQRHGS